MAKYRLETVAAIATALSLLLVLGCGEGVEGETGSVSLGQSDGTNTGECNRIVAGGMETAQICYRSGCELLGEECDGFRADFAQYFANADCATDFLAGEADGLAGNAALHPQTGEIKHIGEVICSAVVQCGLCNPEVPAVCGGPCGF